MISVISPIYNEAENLAELVARVTAAMESCGEPFEYILVENGSSDASLEVIQGLHAQDPRIKYVSLSRNFGHQGGILAGLAHAAGEAVVSLDGDLQQPPELIPRMVELWKQGYDVVYTTKKEGTPKGLRRLLTWCFYRLISLVSSVKLFHGQSDFRLLDREVVDVLLRIPERNKFLRGLVQWVGYRAVGIAYEVERRKRGRSKFSLRGYFGFAMDGILSFSSMPLRIFLYSGLCLAAVCVSYAVYAFVIGVLNFWGYEAYHLPPGWATLAVSVMFLNAVQFVGIGILGEYIGRIFTQAKGRPEFIVRRRGLVVQRGGATAGIPGRSGPRGGSALRDKPAGAPRTPRDKPAGAPRTPRDKPAVAPGESLDRPASETGAKYLIVNADDLGLCVGTNSAIGRAFREGLVTSASLLANMPAFWHAVTHVVRENPELGMGIHLCLTSGRPLLPAAEVPLLVDARGHFRHGFLGLLRLLASRQREDALRQIARELDAQAQRVEDCGIKIDHVDSHQHVHMIPGIFALSAAIARRHGAAIRVADEPWRFLPRPGQAWLPCLLGGGWLKKLLLSNLAEAARQCGGAIATADHYVGVLQSGRMTAGALREILQKLPEGVTEINVHPSRTSGDHGGDYPLCCSAPDRRFVRSPHRVTEWAALMDRSLPAEIARLGITLVRFRDILPQPQSVTVRVKVA